MSLLLAFQAAPPAIEFIQTLEYIQEDIEHSYDDVTFFFGLIDTLDIVLEGWYDSQEDVDSSEYESFLHITIIEAAPVVSTLVQTRIDISIAVRF